MNDPFDYDIQSLLMGEEEEEEKEEEDEELVDEEEVESKEEEFFEFISRMFFAGDICIIYGRYLLMMMLTIRLFKDFLILIYQEFCYI